MKCAQIRVQIGSGVSQNWSRNGPVFGPPCVKRQNKSVGLVGLRTKTTNTLMPLAAATRSYTLTRCRRRIAVTSAIRAPAQV